jgi:glycosyltransferase involved in cell wall biosynthesis
MRYERRALHRRRAGFRPVDKRRTLAYAWAVKPRIGIFTRPIDQKTSGSGSHLREIVHTMVETAHEFELVFCHYERNEEFEPYGAAEELILPRNPTAASAALRKAGLDLVHYNPLTIYSPMFVGRRPGASARGPRPRDRVPRVATIHGAAPLFLPEQYSTLKVLHERYIVGALARRMDHLFAVSETTKRFITDTFGVPAGRIDVIYNAVDPGFRLLDEARREGSRFARVRPFVFHLSKFSERKNPWTTLAAFAELAAEDPDLRLVLGGSGWGNEAVLSFLRERGLEAGHLGAGGPGAGDGARASARPRVLFPGFLEKEEIVELMNLAEAFVFPSFYEGFGMPNLEAMACGCPVVTSQAFAIPEIVADAALTIAEPTNTTALADAVRRIRSDAELRASLVDRGRARAREFSWEESVQTILAAYRRLLGEPAGGTGDG